MIPTASSAAAARKAVEFGAELGVASYNLWNLNSPMEDRMRQIAAMINAMQLDVVGVQEVRPYKGAPQLAVLVKDLPGYAYVYQRAQGGPGHEGEEEGVGIVYRTAAVSVVSVDYRTLQVSPKSSDLNKRIVLRAVLRPSNARFGETIDFFVAHFSYDAGQQCESVVELAEWIDATERAEPTGQRLQVLTGDFNTYFDFEWPMLSLTHPSSALENHADNPCVAFRGHRSTARGSMGTWIDVGAAKALGNTFSNFDDQRCVHHHFSPTTAAELSRCLSAGLWILAGLIGCWCGACRWRDSGGTSSCWRERTLGG
jgi:endonuclease/exonuclease/phosphatase family metal-dependent hydrolase